MQTSQKDNYKLQIPKGDSFKNLPASYHVNRLVDVLARKDGGAQAQVAQKCGSCNENNENRRIMPEKEPGSTLKCLF